MRYNYSKLINAYGEHNVESAINFILNSQDLRGLMVSMDCSPEVVGKILHILHGRNAMYSGCYIATEVVADPE